MVGSLAVVLALHLLLATYGCCGPAEDDAMYCAYVHNRVSTEIDTGEIFAERLVQQDASNLTVENTSIQCKGDSKYCFSFWHIDVVDRTKVSILMQGCWDHPDKDVCPESDCVAHTPINYKSLRNNTRFCCCTGGMCNVNVTDNVNITALDLLINSQKQLENEFSDRNYRIRAIIISLTSVGIVAIVILVAFIVVRCCFQPAIPTDAEASLFLVPPTCGLISGQLDLEELKLDSMIHRGRYGEVYKAILNDSDVAVKSLFPSHRQYYYNERDIYMQAHMQHESLAKFCGYYERAAGSDGPAQYMVVTSYVDLGTLTSYLKNNTVDWQTLCRMWHSMSSGLAHLHTEIIVGERVKPTVAHRDFNSRNILVKPDLSCCICDFGLAMKIVTPRLSDSNTVDHDEHLSLADVGTLRYMAPEVLEGSVNLYDCKTSLTQVDMYSLGLVFWEVAMRCQDLYQGLPTPEYRLPFEADVGVHPSFEDMQVLVSRNKARPAFPEIWKDSNLAIRSMKDTIEECWDQDPEARVSAVCVEERSREMGAMWDNWHRCMTPTINFSHLKDLEDKAVVQHNITFNRSSVSSLTAGDAPTTALGSEPTATTSSHSNTDRDTGNDPTVSYPREQSTSTVTIETMMTLSPSDTHESTTSTSQPTTTGKPDCNLIYARMNVARQPHQGHNPTVERNTHKNSDEELAIEGNTLINKRAGTTLAPQHNGNNGVNRNTLLLDSMTRNVDTGALIQNDILDFQNQNLHPALSSSAPLAPNGTADHHHQNGGRQAPRAQHRITFVPNLVDAPGDQVFSEPIVRPKKQNIPANGDINYSVAAKVPASASHKTSRLGQLKKQLIGGGGKASSSTRKFSFPSFGWRAAKPTHANGGVGNSDRKPGEVCQLSSEVCLVDGRTVVRPNSLALNGICVAPNERRVSNRNLDAETEEEHLRGGGGGTRSSGPANAPRQKSNSCGDASPTGSEVVNETSAKSSSGENGPCNLPDGAVLQAPNGDVVPRQNGGGGATVVFADNSSSSSDGSTGDNMGYEASCSPAEKVKTCLV